MLRHEFRPGRLVVGLALAAAGAVFAGDAAGWWQTPWFVMIPLVAGGMVLGGVTSAVARGMRSRRGGEAQ
ncbi:hypothetical protein [Streptomyces sp. IBSBF 3136]|uniref:hypothetical protein n=1 Tax=Streptomyces sp. IBSBF 3136 TaxID=2903524 RepID=UPI002FDBC1A7